LNKKTIIFDLDGTLLDSLQDIVISVNQVLEKLNYPTHELEAYKQFIGDGARKLLLRALPKDIEETQIDIALELFTEIYSKTIHANTKPYDGIYSMLDSLKANGFSLNLLSNKPQQFTLKYYDIFFSKYDFDYVYGQSEDFPKKPDPKTALHIANQLKVEPQDIYFIGDTSTDMKTANNAGMQSIGVIWGMRDKDELLSNGAHFIVNEPKEILDIVL
jgi:phosphoglycolate phosphatase